MLAISSSYDSEHKAPSYGYAYTTAGVVLCIRECSASRQVCYFELVDMARRLVLTGGVLLIPTDQSLLRLLVATLVTLVFLSVLFSVQPYKRADNITVAIGAQLLLLCVFMLAIFMKVYEHIADASGDEVAHSFVGVSDPLELAAMILGCCVILVVGMLVVVTRQGMRHNAKRRERVLRAVTHSVTTLQHPLAVVPFSTLCKLGKLLPHEAARDASMLVLLDTLELAYEFASVKSVLFFSHQWLSFAEPDPQNLHYKAMIEAATRICEEHGVDASELYIWVDIMSIPQQNEVRAS